MAITFHQLNDGWNAEPNAPAERVDVDDGRVVLEFTLNAFAYPSFAEEQRGELIFDGCSQFRLGPTNDEGWYRGQCRFSKVAPAWGEFFEITGNTRDEEVGGWQPASGEGSRHFLFYLRDRTFECKAANWQFKPLPQAREDRA